MVAVLLFVGGALGARTRKFGFKTRKFQIRPENFPHRPVFSDLDPQIALQPAALPQNSKKKHRSTPKALRCTNQLA
ncbi:hypothetical protein CGZ90_17290 [Fictibacillus aquaticus]|uniref:Uncharacterized protein n=1 Tax=Fictibacillus aquaticus TaxID=2021314 RepID=A0A235F694_9BACL|nr:hypothetical protein CGZ90_17290 [Fictibacillus aquaticus]